MSGKHYFKLWYCFLRPWFVMLLNWFVLECTYYLYVNNVVNILRLALNTADLNILWTAGRLLPDSDFCLTFSRWLSAPRTALCHREFTVVKRSTLRLGPQHGALLKLLLLNLGSNLVWPCSLKLAYKQTDTKACAHIQRHHTSLILFPFCNVSLNSLLYLWDRPRIYCNT